MSFNFENVKAYFKGDMGILALSEQEFRVAESFNQALDNQDIDKFDSALKNLFGDRLNTDKELRKKISSAYYSLGMKIGIRHSTDPMMTAALKKSNEYAKAVTDTSKDVWDHIKENYQTKNQNSSSYTSKNLDDIILEGLQKDKQDDGKTYYYKPGGD